jgi:hypothetical protein
MRRGASAKLLKGRSAPGEHVTAVSRRTGQIDVFTVGIDIFVPDDAGKVMSAAWNPTQTAWKGWWQSKDA